MCSRLIGAPRFNSPFIVLPPPLRLTIRGANLSVKTFQTAKEEEEKEEERTFVLASRKGMSHHLQFVIVIIILKFFPPLLVPRGLDDFITNYPRIYP